MESPIKNIPSIAENEYVVDPNTKINALNQTTSIAKAINPETPIATNNQRALLDFKIDLSLLEEVLVV